LLYSNLDLKEAQQITADLDQAGIKYELKGDGSTIMVSRDKVASTRLMLSSKGLPTSGSVGYEIFDNASALGQTDFVQQLNMKRATEGELQDWVRTRLRSTKMPCVIEFRDELPYSPTGKLLRRVLRDELAEGANEAS